MTTDAPTLAFVHGGFCSASDWHGVIDRLSPSFPIIADNLPGHGGAPLPGDATIAAMAEALRHSLSTAPRVIIVAHSMGCAVALEAARNARGIIGLLLIDGGIGASVDTGRSRAALAAQIEAIGVGAFLERIADGWFKDPQLLSAARARLMQLDPDFARDLLLDAMRWEEEEAATALEAVRVPLLAVQTTMPGPSGRRSLSNDETTPWLDLVRTRVPNAHALVLKHMSHFPHLEHSAAISDIVATFAGELQ